MPVLPRVRGAEKQSASTPALPLATAKSRRRSRLPILTSAARRCRRLLSSTRAPATHPAAAARPRVQPRAKTWALPTTGDLGPLVPERRQAASPLNSTAASILRPDRRSRSRTRSCRSSSECELLSRTSWFLIRYSPINHAPFSSSLLVAMPRSVIVFLAEREGFEPSKLLRACRFSRPVHSTALPPLHSNQLNYLRGFYQATEAISGVDVSILFPLWAMRRPKASPAPCRSLGIEWA